MGHVRMDFQLANPGRRERWLDIHDARLDNVATLTVIPRRITEEPDFEALRFRTTRTVEGRQNPREAEIYLL